MIHAFSETCGTPLYAQYLQFRHRVFNRDLGYHRSGFPVFAFPGPGDDQDAFEFDLYDQVKSLHFAWLQPEGEFAGQILGCLRFVPTDGNSMVYDSVSAKIWRCSTPPEDLPRRADVVDGSRIAIAKGLPIDLHQRVLDGLVIGSIQIATLIGWKFCIGVMTERYWKSVYQRRGIGVEYLSEPFLVDDGEPILIGRFRTDDATLQAAVSHSSSSVLPAFEIRAELLLRHRKHAASAPR